MGIPGQTLGAHASACGGTSIRLLVELRAQVYNALGPAGAGRCPERRLLDRPARGSERQENDVSVTGVTDGLFRVRVVSPLQATEADLARRQQRYGAHAGPGTE